MFSTALVATLLSALDAPPTVAVVAPAEAVPAGAPGWCAQVTAKEPSPRTKLTLSSDIYGGMTLEQMGELVLFSCSDADEPARRAWVQAVRQSLSNEYGLSLADNERVMKLAASVYGEGKSYRPPEREADPGCQQLAPLREGTYAQRFTRTLERVAIGCGEWQSRENREVVPRRFGADTPPYWVIDFEGGLGSELAKAAFVNLVLTDFTPLSQSAREDLRYYRPWVNASAVTLDEPAFRAQLEALALPEISAVKALLSFRRAVARFERQKAVIVAAAAKRKGLDALFLSGPKAAREKAAAALAANRQLFDEVLALEAQVGERPGGLNGCGKRLFPFFEKWARATAKAEPKLTPLELSMGDFVGSQLAYALTLCGLNDEGAPVMDQAFGYYFHRSPALRGPIAASQAGSVDGFNLAQARGKAWALSVDPAAPVVSPPSLGESVHTPFLPYDPHQLSSGVVAAVKTKGETTQITFRAEARKEPRFECGSTDKVWRVTPGGSKVYEYKCKRVADASVTGAPKPITVPSWAAGGIKSGTVVRYWRYDDDANVRGWVIEAFADKALKKRVNLLGAGL